MLIYAKRYVIVTRFADKAVLFLICRVMADICTFVMIKFRCMETLASKNWCPIPGGVLEKVKKKKAEREQRNADGRTNNTGACCACCAQPRVAA
jgi:hypothetical protein